MIVAGQWGTHFRTVLMVAPARRRRIALVASFAVLLSLTSMQVGASNASAVTTTTSPAIAASVLSALNSERTTHGLKALRMNSKLVASAHSHNMAMAAANTLSHQLPGELSFSARITKAGYIWGYAGENVAWTSDMTQNGALTMQYRMFNEVPPNNGHRLNILNPHYVDAGIDIVLDLTHNALWITEDLASPR
jgi:uncharacterized protein YkwD